VGSRPCSDSPRRFAPAELRAAGTHRVPDPSPDAKVNKLLAGAELRPGPHPIVRGGGDLVQTVPPELGLADPHRWEVQSGDLVDQSRHLPPLERGLDLLLEQPGALLLLAVEIDPGRRSPQSPHP